MLTQKTKHFLSIALVLKLVVLILFVLLLRRVDKPVHAFVGPRFEHITTEESGDGGFIYQFEVVHDKTTGAEVVCVRSFESGIAPPGISCWLTGRKW